MERNPQSFDGVHPQSEAAAVDRRRFLAQMAAAGLAAGAAETLLSGATASAAVAAGTTLRLRANFDIQNTDPAFWPTHIDEWIALCTMEGLVSFKPGTFDTVNCLATSLEPSKDGKRIHFKLRQGVEFHGGYGEMTSDDVKYSYERIAGITKPNLHAVYQGDWAALRRVKTEGKYAGTIILKESFAPLGRSTMPAGSGTGRVQEGRAEARQEVRDASDRHGAVRVHELDAQAEDRAESLRPVRGHQQGDSCAARPSSRST